MDIPGILKANPQKLVKNMPRKEYADSSVIVTVIRKKVSLDGKFLEYLKSNNEGATSAILKATKAFYLPYYLLNQLSNHEQIKQAAIEAISDLECQIAKIKRHFNLEQLPSFSQYSSINLPTESPLVSSKNVPEQDEDDDEDDCQEIKINLDAEFRY